ncbi:MAG: DUF2905 domain-containing protein [Anaerolineales bacterium]|nr:DUF2905 domain-containing protein [Anaerolineales bacterium]
MIAVARFLVLAGAVLMIAGGLIYLAARFGVIPGRLPGDIRFERGNFTCVLALGTSILISVILTVLLNLISRWLNK